jgi:hypothetical protein
LAAGSPLSFARWAPVEERYALHARSARKLGVASTSSGLAPSALRGWGLVVTLSNPLPPGLRWQKPLHRGDQLVQAVGFGQEGCSIELGRDPITGIARSQDDW